MRSAIAAVGSLVDALCGSPPRLLVTPLPKPVIVFIDGACDPGHDGLPNVSIGACLFKPGLSGPLYFGCSVGRALVQQWAVSSDSQVIGQAELLPVLISVHTWAEHLRGLPCIIFVDNDSARHGLVSGYSPLLKSAALIAAVLVQLARLGAFPWFARVPSCSNIADAPSRLEFGPLSRWAGSELVEPSFAGASGQSLWAVVASSLYG